MRRPVVSLVAAAGAAASWRRSRTGRSTRAPRASTTLPVERCSPRQGFEMLAARLLGRRASHPPGSQCSGDADAANRAEIDAASPTAVAGDPRFGTPSLEPGATRAVRSSTSRQRRRRRARRPTQAVRDLRDRHRQPGRRRHVAEHRLLRHRRPVPADRRRHRARAELPGAADRVPLASSCRSWRSLMNLLSVGAAYGLLVLVMQKGYGAGLLGFHAGRHDRGLDPAVPVLACCSASRWTTTCSCSRGSASGSTQTGDTEDADRVRHRARPRA